ncbi:MAG: CCA tRNA nucleotidyltransferase [Planctomycetes bacterium]|nr:CCA tRNA nucleotidyltransferase [Planctomycetota bacterium]
MSNPAREFAEQVVRRLRAAGFAALWAGGCVRDELLGRVPKDYDVATEARPDEVTELFGRRRTIGVGKSFGVMIVLGPRGGGQIDVATFRRDAAYSDGRHPDAVAFSNAEEDARRRDFTINGLFYDPLADEIIDYVDGQRDIERRVVRTIGNADDRFGEDKLRLLRAVRFAAGLDFALEEGTKAALTRLADQITVVSRERIAQELRTMLGGPSRAVAARLLRETGLLAALFPGLSHDGPNDAWEARFGILQRIEGDRFCAALAVLFSGSDGKQAAETCRELRLTSKETQRVRRLVEGRGSLGGAAQQPWSKLQRLLIREEADDLVAVYAAESDPEANDDAAFCRAKLAQPDDVLNPPPLLTGNDLNALGLAPGAIFKTLLEQVRDEQLEGRISDRQQALELVERLLAE